MPEGMGRRSGTRGSQFLTKSNQLVWALGEVGAQEIEEWGKNT